MEKILHRGETRGFAEHGWLKSWHTFSFANYHNKERVHFGALRVLNDDIIEGGQGFGTHPHQNMEIVSIPLEGALKHRDSMGHERVIRKGEVQIMSAGTGVQHSEFNDSAVAPVNLLQIWVLPQKDGIAPRYDQKFFSSAERKNKFQTVVAPDSRDASLWINQQAFFSLADLEARKNLVYEQRTAGSGYYLFVITGAVTVGNELLEKRDAIAISNANSIEITAVADSELLLIEVPMNLRLQ